MRRPLLVDALFALTMTIAVMAGSMPAGREQPEMRALDGLAWAILAVAGLALTFRRRWPFLSVAVTFTLTMTYVYLDYPYGPIFLYTMVAVYSAAAWRSLGYSLAVGALTIGSHLPWSWWVEKDPDGLPFSLFTGAVWLVSPIAVGIAVRARREADARGHAEERIRHVSEERLRMAQEVHDTVGHSLAVISMNAGAALHVLTKAPDAPLQLGDSLRAIRSASGSALDELRAVLATRTTSGLASLPSLVAATRVDGLTVTLTTSGDPPPLPSNVDLAAYRIAQEALANIVRHSGATHATVAVTYLPDGVDLRITDNGPAAPADAPTSLPSPLRVVESPLRAGSGIPSMHNRALQLGGTFTAGRLPSGGFEVHATLPDSAGDL